MSIDPASILMNIDPATILMFFILIIIVIINIAVFVLYLLILFKTIYLPKKINFKGFIKKTFRFFTFGYFKKMPELLLNITNFFAVMGVIFIIAVLMFILINIVLLGPVNLAVFPYFSEPIKIAFLIVAFIYAIVNFLLYLKNIEGFEQYNNQHKSTLKHTKLKNYDDKRLITLERNIPVNSKNITIYRDSFKNKNNHIENFEGYDVKTYSDAY